jgi:Ca2+-binding RTX toxin-like protein
VFGLGGNDVLTGGNGDDVLDGGAGDDVLEGGPGQDVYLYGTGYGHDSVKGARGKGLRGDHVLFGSGVEARYVEFGREGDDLRAVLQPSGGTLTIRDWYGNPANRVDWFELPDGRRLLEGDVDRLIEAQSLSQSPAGGTRSSLSGAGVASAPSELWKR